LVSHDFHDVKDRHQDERQNCHVVSDILATSSVIAWAGPQSVVAAA
jgi:hypothetical protein